MLSDTEKKGHRKRTRRKYYLKNKHKWKEYNNKKKSQNVLNSSPSEWGWENSVHTAEREPLLAAWGASREYASAPLHHPTNVADIRLLAQPLLRQEPVKERMIWDGLYNPDVYIKPKDTDPRAALKRTKPVNGERGLLVDNKPPS